MNPLYTRILCAKFGWNWLSGSGEDENVKSVQIADYRLKTTYSSTLNFDTQWKPWYQTYFDESIGWNSGTGLVSLIMRLSALYRLLFIVITGMQNKQKIFQNWNKHEV